MAGKNLYTMDNIEKMFELLALHDKVNLTKSEIISYLDEHKCVPKGIVKRNKPKKEPKEKILDQIQNIEIIETKKEDKQCKAYLFDKKKFEIKHQCKRMVKGDEEFCNSHRGIVEFHTLMSEEEMQGKMETMGVKFAKEKVAKNKKNKKKAPGATEDCEVILEGKAPDSELPIIVDNAESIEV